MSAPEHVQETDAIGSRIKVTRNAKGEPQWEISVREGIDAGELMRLRKLAVSEYRALEDELSR